MNLPRVVCGLFLLVVSRLSAAELQPVDWPQWRGPNRDGFVVSQATWPDSLEGEHLEQLWRVELGPGYPGPIVVGDRVFVAETKDRKVEVVRALDRATGKELWQAEWEGAMSVPFFAKANGDWIRSTPACDGETLYVAGMRDVLVALNVADGSQRWRVDFMERFKSPLPSFGFVCSPLVLGDFVYVQAGAGLCKLNKATGETVWRVLVESGGMMSSAFSSPTLATLCGTSQLLVQAREALHGVDPETGAVLWSVEVPAFRGMNILTPTTFGDGVLTSSYGGKTTLYKVARTEEAGQPKFSVEPAWTEKSQGYMSTPVLMGQYAYLHLRNQRFMCIDLESGERKWTTTPFGQYWSLVASGDRILALDDRGQLLLVAAQPTEFKLLSERKISEAPTWGHLALRGNELFIRELNALTAYRWK